MEMLKNILTAVLITVLVGGFIGVVAISGLIWALRRRRRHEIAGLTYIKASQARVGSSASWMNASSVSIASPKVPSPTRLKRQISEPMLLKNFEGKGVTLPPHISEMLNMHTKMSCPALPPLAFSPDASLRQLPYGPELDQQNPSRVPMLLRQPRKKSVNNLHAQLESVYSVASAESIYSEASAPSHIHHMFSTATSNYPPASSLTPSAPSEDIELFSVRMSENRGSSYWTLDPTRVTRISASLGEINKVTTPFIDNLYFSPPGIPVQSRASIELPSSFPMPPAVPPRSPLRSKSVPNLLR